jgi:YHS domain-containing protein
MFRALLYVIAFTLILSVVRSILGIIAKAFTGQSDTSPTRAGTPPSPPSSSAPSGGELKKDPVCGTFISTATAFQKYSGGQTYYFCSSECRDKFKG